MRDAVRCAALASFSSRTASLALPDLSWRSAWSRTAADFCLVPMVSRSPASSANCPKTAESCAGV